MNITYARTVPNSKQFTPHLILFMWEIKIHHIKKFGLFSYVIILILVGLGEKFLFFCIK